MLFRDPVFVPESGNTYERNALLRFWNSSPAAQLRDPLTNLELTSDQTFANWDKRREVSR